MITVPVKLFVPVKRLVPLSSATLVERSWFGMVPVNWDEGSVPARLVALVAVVAVVALPARLPVMVPAEKLPEASRLTISLAVLALAAALAATAPPATLAADWPPTVATTVEPCDPVTSPASEPEKLLAVAAVVALVAVVAVEALPARLPLNWLAGLVMITVPVKLF